MGELDINVGKLKKNAFRYSKVRGETASRIRIPGGVIDAKAMQRIVEIAEKYGDGVIDITNRQGIEIPGIALEDMEKVNAEVQAVIDSVGTNQAKRGAGYPSSGTRNVVGARVEARRKELGMKQKELLALLQEKDIEINASGLSKLEGQIRSVPDYELIALAEALDISVTRLLGLEE